MSQGIELKYGDKIIIVDVVRKKIKSARLKVFADSSISFSVPEGVSEKWIMDYLNAKKDWMIKKTDGFWQTRGVETVNTLKSGVSIKLFGQNRIVLLKASKKTDVVEDENKIIIYTRDDAKAFQILEKWLKEKLLDESNRVLEKLYPIIKKHSIPKPEIVIRKMKSMWGNCLRRKGKITLNFYLYQAASPYIEYVILHELAHFLYKNHTVNFYNIMSIYMPDWKKRKMVLDYEIIQNF